MSDLIVQRIEALRTDFGLTPVIASEIEFYLTGADSCADMPGFWQKISDQCTAKGISLFKTDKENGKEQFEVALTPADPLKTATDTKMLKNIIEAAALSYKMIVDFSAKPFVDQPGSGLHIHIHLADAQGKNIFFKKDTTISPALQQSIGGLLAWLNPCMAVFAPHTDSYKRFQAKSNAPLTVSWGANNRTVAIRLPDSTHDNKRIEHRVAGSDADPQAVMAVIVAAIHYGLKNQCALGPQIFGDASLPMYNLPPIITSLAEATAQMQKTKLFSDYFSASDLLPTH